VNASSTGVMCSVRRSVWTRGRTWPAATLV